MSSEPSTPGAKREQRLIVVSNRLPVTIKKDASGKYTYKMSSGGLVSALSGCKKTMSFTWIGWPGQDIPMEDREEVNAHLLKEYQCYPVYLSDELADRHYNGFSNSILWPLFHYHPGEMNFVETHWLAYREANMRFAEVVNSFVSEGDMVWVQDYHLMLLPMLLRAMISGQVAQGETTRKELSRMAVGVPSDVASHMGIDEGVADVDTPYEEDEEKQLQEKWAEAKQRSDEAAEANGKGGVKIGFFLHTPFPSSEIYRILPVRREILLGVLQCDLIGFHTYDYARHFLSSCTRILGLPTMPNGVNFEGRYAHVGTFPIGIEPMQFVEGLRKESVQKRLAQLEKRFEGVKVIVGVDRLDYIKGVPQKMHAMEIFLEQHPEWIGKVVLVQLAIPSRQDVEEYQNLRSMVNELVGRINGQFGTVEYVPIHFMHTSVPLDELTAMYALSDACLVTSTRDGMNLVAYEYISSQVDKHGVMILSEFAGAAQSLNGSVIMNPWDVQSTADAIHAAVTMDAETRKSNHEKLWRYVSTHTSERWGTDFVTELKRIHGAAPPAPVPMAKQRRKSMADSVRSFNRRRGSELS
ncbi:Trehalose-6-P synthase/phosphatase complex synthase subunit [Naganishia albida]|nr:Trehalose-6-P synthase/phosphatase complex synthase subunit [Naganishia albida]